MAQFPTPDINPLAPAPRLGTKENKTFAVIRSEFENTYAQVRRVTTKPRHIFSLDYTALTLAEFQILETHFDTHVGTTFLFVHPLSLVSYTVTYQKAELEKSYRSSAIVDTTIILETL